MITELTDEQIALFPNYVDKWTKIGLSCEPLNEEVAKQAVIDAYKVAVLEPPRKFIVCDSPMSGALTIAKFGTSVRDSVKDSVRVSVWDSIWASVWDSIWASAFGSHDAHWLSFYDYMLHVLGDDEPIATVHVTNNTPEPDGTYKKYWIRVPPGTKTAKEAVAWTWDLPHDFEFTARS